MLSSDHLSTAKELIDSANQVLIIFPEAAKRDLVWAAVSLAKSLESQDKKCRLLSPQAGAFNYLQSTTVLSELGNKDLRITFPYTQDLVDKVSYSIDEGQQLFHLVIQPKSGSSPLDTTKVSYDYIGAQADLIITLGVKSLESLDQLYDGYESLYESTPIITVSNFEPSFGTLKLDTSDVSSYCEGTFRLLDSLTYPISSESATLLLAGIEQETQMFHSSTASAETFECIAKLLRMGARRAHSNNETQDNGPSTQAPKETPSNLRFLAETQINQGTPPSHRQAIQTNLKSKSSRPSLFATDKRNSPEPLDVEEFSRQKNPVTI